MTWLEAELEDSNALLRKLPRVDDVLAQPVFVEGAEGAPHILCLDAAREAIEQTRSQIVAGDTTADISVAAVAATAGALLRNKIRPSLRRAINAAGIVLHTGLGRAPLSAAAQAALAEAGAGYCNVQADPRSGERVKREIHVESLLQKITGAEAAAVVNNNAAATVLVLNTLAAGKEVVVSRGEMVEIGGSFRLPEILQLSGCRLVEVGCTNRTHLRDYRNAITPETALLLPIHQSNYRIVGFASQPPVEELAALAKEQGIICAHDLGSGALLDLRQFGLPHEPSVPESLKAGAEVVFFSGDKLVGGPQCGIILGQAKLIERMRKNPFYRTFRVDKLTLAVLEATLRLFLKPEKLTETHAVLAMLTAAPEKIKQRAQRVARRLKRACGKSAEIDIEAAESEVGGGSLAGYPLPTYVIQIRSDQVAAQELVQRLRMGEPAIFSRVQEDSVLLDMRTVLPEEEEALLSGVAAVLKSTN